MADDGRGSGLERAANSSAELANPSSASVERTLRAERVATLLDHLEATDGPLTDDPAEDARLARLLDPG